MFLKTRGKSKATNFVLNLINMDLILTERGGGGGHLRPLYGTANS